MKIVVVSPHRDDAAFSLGLAVGTWLQKGYAVEVVNVFTRSEYAPYSDADSLHPNDRMSFASAVRKREDESWVKLYVGQLGRGKLTLTDLNLKDAPLRLHCSLGEVQQREPDLTEKVSSKIKRSLEMSKADAIVLPLGVGNHVDHLTARIACLPTDAQAFALAFYEDLPYAAQAPETIEGAVQATSLAAAVPLEAVFVSEVTDVEAAVARKRKLGLCYDSQMDDAGVEQIAEFCGQYEGRERLWANREWRLVFDQIG
jgi:LmbE family N-acetylglucosaminyl deacetylase